MQLRALVLSVYGRRFAGRRDVPGAVCGMLRRLWNWISKPEKSARDYHCRETDSPIAPGSHPTALLLSPDEKLLYVALSQLPTGSPPFPLEAAN